MTPGAIRTRIQASICKDYFTSSCHRSARWRDIRIVRATSGVGLVGGPAGGRQAGGCVGISGWVVKARGGSKYLAGLRCEA